MRVGKNSAKQQVSLVSQFHNRTDASMAIGTKLHTVLKARGYDRKQKEEKKRERERRIARNTGPNGAARLLVILI